MSNVWSGLLTTFIAMLGLNPFRDRYNITGAPSSTALVISSAISCITGSLSIQKSATLPPACMYSSNSLPTLVSVLLVCADLPPIPTPGKTNVGSVTTINPKLPINPIHAFHPCLGSKFKSDILSCSADSKALNLVSNCWSVIPVV